MSDTVHYKFGVSQNISTPFCELPPNYNPKKNSATKNKLSPLSDGASFGEGFCSICNDKLKELKLIKE